MSQLSKREEVWIMAYSAFISSRADSVATIEDAAYADKALAEFDKRFPEIKVWDRQLFLLKLDNEIRNDSTPTSFFAAIKKMVDNILEYRKTNSQL